MYTNNVLGAFLNQLPAIVTHLFKLRGKGVSDFLMDYTHEPTWKKAQELEPHVEECGENLFVFTNYRFEESKVKKVTKKVIQEHVNAYSTKSFQEFKKKRILYLYDHEIQICECRTFWHYGFCKHMLAVRISLQELDVRQYFH